MSKLSDAQRGVKPATPAPSKMALALSGVRVFRPVKIPGLGIDADMTVVGHAELVAIESRTFSTVKNEGIGEPDIINAMIFEAERAAQTLAAACFDPEERKHGRLVAIGSVDDWRALPEEYLSPLWDEYKALRFSLDPVAVPLSREEHAELLAHVKKKDATALMRYERWRLVAFMLTTDDPPSS